MSKKSLTAAFVVSAAVLLISGCGYQQPASSGVSQQAPTQNSSASTSAQNNQIAGAVTIKNFAFSPATLTVAKGTKVTWMNEDSTPHQIASDSGSAVSFSGPAIPQGQSYSFTFNTAGEFSYHCAIHPSMLGKIIVQ
jgi:plastocyanin